MVGIVAQKELRELRGRSDTHVNSLPSRQSQCPPLDSKLADYFVNSVGQLAWMLIEFAYPT
jgi:hypothetical protein